MLRAGGEYYTALTTIESASQSALNGRRTIRVLDQDKLFLLSKQCFNQRKAN